MIHGFHAHIYFDPDQVDLARLVAAEAAALFEVTVGRFHLKPVGPHPRGSVQLTVATERFGELTQWLALNRRSLTVFVHPETGDVWADHIDRAIWFGASETLNTAALD